jgi:regulator of sigma E protease
MATIVLFVVILSILVLAHELGHYVVGRWAKARIEEFAIGFPPRIWSVRRNNIDYSINAIPLGGYVRFAGEDNPNVAGGLSSLPRSKRALVLLAGVTMNFLLAIFLFAAVFATGYPTAVPANGTKIAAVTSGSPAEQAGLKTGDIVLGVNGQAMNQMEAFSAAVHADVGEQIALLVKHADGQQETINVVPRVNPPSGEGPLGIAIEQAATMERRTYSLPEALWKGVQQTWEVVVMTVSVPVMIVRGLVPLDVARPIGPVGISRVVGSATAAIPALGFAPILELMALFSVSLAVVNILPLPGLDGGRLIFVLLEWLRGGKRINPEREAIIHLTGLMLLFGLMIVITYFDIVSPTPPVIWGP